METNQNGMATRARRRCKIGVVVSDKMQKTITVSVERTIQHPKYKKYIRRDTKFKAHDANGEAKMGDKVEIMETRPLSKTKNWRLLRILERKISE